MSNPLFNILNNSSNSFIPNPYSNASNFLKAFNEFKNAFKGDPKQQVQELLNSGKMTQEQFNQLSQIANQFQEYFK